MSRKKLDRSSRRRRCSSRRLFLQRLFAFWHCAWASPSFARPRGAPKEASCVLPVRDRRRCCSPSASESSREKNRIRAGRRSMEKKERASSDDPPSISTPTCSLAESLEAEGMMAYEMLRKVNEKKEKKALGGGTRTSYRFSQYGVLRKKL